MFQKIVIANRGEIALRIIRACRELGIFTVAVCSEADREALHAQLADQTICIGKAASKESYLNMERILSATIVSGAQAIHPGFGFLSENAKFVQLCEKCNITFIGPSSSIIAQMGDKAQARNTMIKAGVPVVPGTQEPLVEANKALVYAREIGFPIMIKASAGGGGKGMRISWREDDFLQAFQAAQREAENAFSDGTMYLEKYIVNPRHIEFQIFGDQYGNVVHLGERDCSLQRKHQKVLEESPSPALSDALRKEMGEVAIRAAKAVGYQNAGTVEFILDQTGNYYFIEMNTRIQVEHPVTEMVTGLDLIQEQIKVAAGMPLSVRQEDIVLQGHAIECRINAEKPEQDFRPCPGTVHNLHFPAGNGIRVDSALFTGYTIPPYYDSMIAKVIVHAKTRKAAIQKMKSALGEFVIEGMDTNLDFQYALLEQELFQAGQVHTGFLEEMQKAKGV